MCSSQAMKCLTAQMTNLGGDCGGDGGGGGGGKVGIIVEIGPPLEVVVLSCVRKARTHSDLLTKREQAERASERRLIH